MFSIGPKNDKITGYNIIPFNMPNTIMIVHVFQNTLKVYSVAKAITEMASRVEKPPWKTLDPI